MNEAEGVIMSISPNELSKQQRDARLRAQQDWQGEGAFHSNTYACGSAASLAYQNEAIRILTEAAASANATPY